MGTKQIRLDEDVYARIEDKKRDGESFSDAIDRLTDDWRLSEWSTGRRDDEIEAHREAIEDIEKQTEQNVDELVEELDISE